MQLRYSQCFVGTEGTTTGVTTPSVLGSAVLRILWAFVFASATTAVAGAAGIRQFAQVRQGGMTMALTEIMNCRSNVFPTVLPNPSNAIKSATVLYVLSMLLFPCT